MVRSILFSRHLPAAAIVVAVVFVAAVVAPGCGSDAQPSSSPSADTVMATVDGSEVRASDVELVRAERRLMGEADGATAALDEAIERDIMYREAERLGAEADESVIAKRLDELESAYGDAAVLDAVLDRAGLDRSQLRRSVADGVLRESLRDAKFSSTTVSAKAVNAYYRRNVRRLFTDPASVHLAAIQVRTEKVAENAIGLLAEGRPFSEVAHALSTDPASRDNGGDLGWVLTSSLPLPLHKAVAASGPGLITKPVGGGSMWYVLNVIGERPARVIPLDEVRTRLTDELTRVERAQALERWLDAARERATVVLP